MSEAGSKQTNNLRVLSPYRNAGRMLSTATSAARSGRAVSGYTHGGPRMSQELKMQQEETSQHVMKKILDLLKRQPAQPTRQEPKRYFNFDADALKQGQSLDEVFDARKEVTDIRDVIDLDDDDVEEIITGDITMKGVESGVFRMFVTLIILCNALLIGIRANNETERKFRPLFNTVDSAVLAIFVLEMLLKFYASFILYWHDWWNVLDFSIIVVMLVTDQLSVGTIGSSIAVIRIVRIIRILRAFRSLRNIPILMGLSVLIETIIRSIPDMVNIGMLLGMFLLVWSIFGASLFSEIPDSFRNFFEAMWTNFICLTEDGWWEKFFNIRKNAEALAKWHGGFIAIYSFYFVISIGTGAFLFKNLVIAAVINNLQNAIKAIKIQEQVMKENSNVPRMETDAEMNDKTHMALHTEERLNMIGFNDILKSFNFETQWPLEVSDLRKLTFEKFTRFAFLLQCLDENLAEYANAKERLDRVFNAVNDLNSPGQKGRELNQLIMMIRHSQGPAHPRPSDPNASGSVAYLPYGTGLDNSNALSPTTDLMTAITEESNRRFSDAKRTREHEIQKQEQYFQQQQLMRQELLQQMQQQIDAAEEKTEEKTVNTNKRNPSRLLTKGNSSRVSPK